MESKQKMKNEKSIMIGINVLGLFQTTCGKSTRTWQPEKSNRESFSWFSASVFGSRHEKGSGITVLAFLLVKMNNSWSSLADFEYVCKNKLGVWSTIEFLWKWNKAKSRLVLFNLLQFSDTRTVFEKRQHFGLLANYWRIWVCNNFLRWYSGIRRYCYGLYTHWGEFIEY